MRETEDQRITDKFRQVFEDFEDPSSHEGWQELRKKYPEEKSRPLLFWIGSAAAIVVMLSAALWLFKPDRTQDLKIGKSSSVNDPQKTELNTEPADPNKMSFAPAEKKEVIKEESDIKSVEPVVKKIVFAKTGAVLIKDSLTYSKLPDQVAIPAKDTVSAIEYAIAKTADITEKQPVRSDTTVLVITKAAKTDQSIKIRPNDLINPEEKSSKSAKNENFALSLYAGSFINYAEGSENNINIGAGLSSDFRISKNLKISTGLNLSKNSLNYKQNVPDNKYGSFQSANSSVIGNLVVLSDYQAELLSLDIPVNVKYLFNPEKNDTYFLAGLSSGTYLSERYGVQYSNFNTMIGAATNQEQEIKKQLQSFDLMRTLNVSFGFNTRISKKQSLTIEPFVKYPLGGLGSENIRFGASGINVKMNFNTTKKH